MRGEGAFTLVVSNCDGHGVSCGIDSINVLALLWVQVEGTSAGDVATELMRILAAAASFLRAITNYDSQSVALFHAPDIHSKVILYVADSSDHWFPLFFVFLPLRKFCKSVWLLHIKMSDLWR